MDGNNRRVVLDLSPQGRLIKLSVLNNVMYYQEVVHDFAVLYRADVQRDTKQLVYNGTGVFYLEILPDARDFESSNVNPCAHIFCSHMCVQSSQKEHACLCPIGYVIQRASGNCVGNILTFH